MMKDEVNKCLSCLNPLCEKACPLHNHIRDFIKALKEDDLNKAKDILYKENPFAAITCRICNVQKQCVGHCIKGIKGEAVLVNEIEEYISHDLKLDVSKKEKNGRKVALVGAGISNLALAYFLVKEGYTIDLFEKSPYVGGVIKTGIPHFRFDYQIFETLAKQIISMGICVHLNHPIDDIESLKAEYDYVVCGIGASVENKMTFENSEYAISGLRLLYDLNVLDKKEDYKKYKNALVIGGGNVAMDCARSLSRMMRTTLMYRRSLKEMPASLKEIEDAKKEGVHFSLLKNINKIYVEEDKVKGVNTISMALGEKDESGRASFHVLKDSDTFEAFDLVVMAIGQKVDLSPLKLISIGNHKTNYENVFVVGDAYLGASNVALCINDAKEVAKMIGGLYEV